MTIVGKNLAGTYGGHYPGFRIRHDSSGRLLFQVADSQDRFVLWGNAKIPANEWHHVSAIRAGTDLFIYIDGELDAVAIGAVSASSNLDTSHPFAVGASVYWSSTRYFTGNVDDVTLHSRALTPLELFEQMGMGPDGDDPSLLASYTFEASITTDDSGHGHDLTLIGGAEPGKGTSGSRHTLGAHFNGSSVVRFASSAFDMGSLDFTLSGWFRADTNATATDMTIAAKSLAGSYGGTYKGYRLFHKPNRGVAFSVCDGTNTFTVYSKNYFAVGEWRHASAIRRGSDLLLYVDGKLEGASYGVLPTSFNVSNSSHNFAVGAAAYWSTGRHFHGDIDGVSLHSRAFTEREVNELMAFGPLLQDTSLRGFVAFDQADFLDESSYQHPATLDGSLIYVPGARWTGYDEIDDLEMSLSSFEVVSLPASGPISLADQQALTFGAALELGLNEANLEVASHGPYGANDTNGLPVGTGPHVSPNLGKFRLEQFTTELIYGGNHNAELIEYAGIHGFRSLQMRQDSHHDFMPTGTLKSKIKGHSFKSWFASFNPEPDLYEEDMWHFLPDANAIASELAPFFPYNAEDHYVIDLEGPSSPRSRDSLENGSGSTPPHVDFPHGGSPQEQDAFFEAYYQGFVSAEVATMIAARNNGHPSVGIYGLWPRTWFGIDEPLPQQEWDDYLKYIAVESDIIYSSVYFFYRNVRNVAYVVANIDRINTLRAQLPQGMAPPVRPFVWNMYHGGGGGWRHWQGAPVRNEDLRAAAGMIFFTDVDGLVHWSWSGTRNHAKVQAVAPGDSLVVRNAFTAPSENSSAGTFERQDMIYVLDVTANGIARFQALPDYGGSVVQVDADPAAEIFDDGNYQYPVYFRDIQELRDDLMPTAEPMAGEFEGLALVKLIEGTLRHGVPHLDLSESETQFTTGGVVVRQLRAGPLHLVATYDPNYLSNLGPVPVLMEDFAGRTGLDLTLQADEQIRVYVLKP